MEHLGSAINASSTAMTSVSLPTPTVRQDGTDGAHATVRATDAPTFATPLPPGTSMPDETPAVAGQADGPITLHPETVRAKMGQAYPFQLIVHCGVDYAVDFDGSFWDLDRQSDVPEYSGMPLLPGTMILIAPDRARFDPDNFDGASIYFTRHKGPKVVSGPCV